MKVNLPGRYMLPDRREYPCQVIEMSPGDISLYTPVKGNIGDRVIAYLDVVGRIDGKIARLFDGGFSVVFRVPMLKQERLAEKLTWLANKNTLNLSDDRGHDRLVPTKSHSHLSLPDGRNYDCRVIDISLSGAAINAPVCPELGTQIMLGKMRGKVVRHLEQGFAIQFESLVQEHDISGYFN